MIAEHQGIGSNQFSGIFDRGPEESVPSDHFIDALNITFDVNNVKTREGCLNDLTVAKTILRWRTYEKTGEATRYLILDNAGNLFDSTSISSPILTIAGMTDFALQVMFDRAYISPHNGNTGLAGEFIYVYDGTGSARLAGGTAPSTSPNVATSSSPGNVEAGTHLFAVAFETPSGFVTKRGPATPYIAPGGFFATLSSIPVGPSGTVARWLLATKIIPNYNGNPQGFEYFFIPNGRIGDNSTTSFSVSFFDADLTATADFLYDQLDKIPAGVYLGIYKGGLISLGENVNPARVRLSLFSQPESFDSVDGFIDVYPKDNGGPVRNAIEFRNQLIINKSYRSYVTQDNGDVPNTWIVGPLDKSVGSECNGLCKILDVDGTSNDNYIQVSREGLLKFDGSFSEDLAWKIHDIWMRINRLYFHKILVALDPIQERLYVAVPLDSATECSHILYADFISGLSSKEAKWSVWKMKGGISISGLGVDVIFASKIATMKFAGYNGNIYKMDLSSTDDDSVAIDNYIQFAYLTGDERGGVSLFSGIRMLIRGNGNLQINARGLDNAFSVDAPAITLALAPGVEKTREFFLENERCSVKIRLSNFGEWFSLRHFRLFTTPVWGERPTE